MSPQEQIALAMTPNPNLAGRSVPSSLNTQLNPLEEMAFRQWVAQNKVPFDPNAAKSDYDMRGFYQGMQQQNPKAASAVNPNDNRMHFPDFWKTPVHETFSNESQWSSPLDPAWNANAQLIMRGGRIIRDEKAPPTGFLGMRNR